MKKVVFILCSFAIFSFYSCSKSKTEVIPSKLNTQSKKIMEELPSNVNNPHDSIGFHHNESLEYVKLQIQGTNLRNFDILIEKSNEYSKNTFSSNIPDIETYLPSSSYISRILADSIYKFKNVIENSDYSVYSQGKLKDFVASLYLIDENKKYSDIKKDIISFENSITVDNNISNLEKDALLRVTSVARHSMFYWIKEYNTVQNIIVKRRPWWKWLVVGIADVAGGISGAIVAGPTLIGNIAGGISGAAGASAGASTIVDWVSPD